MKKTAFLFILLLLTVGAACICTAGCVTEKPHYVVGIRDSLSPWEYFDNDGNARGIDVELLDLLAEVEGFTLSYVEVGTGWEKALENGEIDIASGLVVTPERQARFICTDTAIAPMRFAVVVRGDSNITLDDVLAGKVRIVVAQYSAHDAWLKSHFGDAKYAEMVDDGRIIYTFDVDGVSYSVLKSEADAGIAGDISISEKLAYYQPLKFLGYVGETAVGCTCIRKDDVELNEMFTNGVRKIKEMPEFEDMIARYNLKYKKPVYRMGIDDDNVPWTDIDTNGTAVGYDIEQMQWIAEQNDFALEFVPMSWGEVTDALLSKKIDLVASSMTITEKRLEKMAFSPSYYASSVAVAVTNRSSLTMEDFDSPRSIIVTISDSIYDEWVMKYLGEEVYNVKVLDGTLIRVNSEDYAFRNALFSGDADFGVCGMTQFGEYVKNGKVDVIYEEKDAVKIGIAMRNDDLILLDMVNNGLAAFEASGGRAELLKKYNL